MSVWLTLIAQFVVTVLAVLSVLLGFWVCVIRPYLDRKVAELTAVGDEIEPRVARGVKQGVADTIRELPENAWDGTVRESTRQFLKFGSGIFENGLSSLLGGAGELQRNAQGDAPSDKGGAQN